jgi:hypothetical protein
MGGCGWLQDQAILPQGKNPIAGVEILCRRGVLIGCGRLVNQIISWCYDDHTWDTQFLVVLENTELSLINSINTSIHPSVSL